MVESILGHSKTCCNIPPVISKGYTGKGEYAEIGGVKTYVTGPSDAKKAILLIPDIFGFFPQTIQGADILATSDKEAQYQVFFPDLFYGEPADIAWYPPETKEQGEKLGAWFGKHGPPTAIEQIPTIISNIDAKYGKKTWGVVGYCWGGKVVTLMSGEGSLFKASAQAHPGMIDPTDAAKVTIPTLMLASKDESPEEVKAWSEALKVPNHVETFGDQIHGWMAARSDLEDAKVKSEYERGYQTFLAWFHKHL